LVVGSNCSPKAVSKIVHADSGNQISGTVESMKERIPFPTGRRDITPWSVLVAWIPCRPTIKGLESSEPKGKLMLLGANLDESYPPSVRLPRTFFAL